MQKAKKYIFTIIAVSLLASLAYSFYFHSKPVVDAKKYDEVGWNLAQGFGYVTNPEHTPLRDYSIFMVGPGYQFFLAGVYALFGHHLGIVWALQALLLAAAGYLTFLISRELFKKNWHPAIGIIAGACVALAPDLIMTSGMILADVLGVFLLTLSVWLAFRYEAEPRLTVLLALSLVLGYAVMVRSVLLLLVPLCLVVFFVKRRWLDAILFLVVLIVMFTPWTVRNYKTFDKFIPFNLAGHIDFWIGNHSGATGELEEVPEMTKFFNEMDAPRVAEISLARGKEFIFTHPLQAASLVVKRASIYASFIRPVGWWPYPGPRGYSIDAVRGVSLALSALYSMLLFTLGIAGAIHAFRAFTKKHERAKLWFFTIATVMMPLGILWLFVESRYRFPIYPFLAIFAGYFLWTLWQNRHEKQWWKNKILWAVFGVLLLNSVIDVSLNVARILERIQ